MRIGILTGGGDCPGLNAVIRAVTKSLIQRCGAEVVGIEDGYLGLIERRVRPLGWDDVGNILAVGGTILGTSNKATPFSWQGRDHSAACAEYVRDLQLEALVAIGGDGTMTIAQRFGEHAGVPVVGVPKTIDNDIEGTERSFGFDTAVATVTDALERVQTTGQSHGRVMIVETMGRYAGWIALESGLAGAADVILLPEIGYDVQRIAKVCRARAARRRSTLICIAEGAKPVGGELTVESTIADSPDPIRLGGVGHALRAQLQPLVSAEVRATVLGHVQRGGSPTPFDRVLATQYGNAAAHLLQNRDYHRMVALQRGELSSVALSEVANKNRLVPADHPLLVCAREIGVCLGDD
ncbi:MAG TPA: ATP-dependent 6-phosphofructokinase [Burkholderiaceae bacterium]|nr:ATP-dependent 6-phosphofructokinase [Burkholderiaceae bacterium]HMX09410.1 ATP-dependent 6-phosphofructokinase [Burkholderiaceae bacterium]HNB46011.1 ATP-dependent 6-phosphofructokinase [Burkholderiaceae bacterium]HNG78117.1 ATP-dependent 6-phosphofructokinase [Burkholderiaceae bacterium]